MQVLASFILKKNGLSMVSNSIRLADKTTVKTFHHSIIYNGLSDPFKPNQKKSTEEAKGFFEKKHQNIKNSEGFRVEDKRENFLTRMVQKSLNPTPLSTDLRKRFKLGEDYKLIYMIENERLHLITFGLMNSVFPLFFVLGGAFLYAEYMDMSQITRSFDNPYLFIVTLAAYFGFAFYMSRLSQNRTIFRLYYNEKLDKYVLIRLKGIIGFRSENFTAKDAIFKLPDPNKNALLQNVDKAMGNVVINGRIRSVEFNQFSTQGSIKKLFGDKMYGLIQSEMNKGKKSE